MPKLNDEAFQSNAGHFGFSGVKIDELGATEYTLVTIVADRSGSVESFYLAMEASLKEIVKACQRSPRADNLMIRLVTFSTTHAEFHGFKLLSTINLSDYDGCLVPQSSTALFDACVDGIEGMSNYGKYLIDQDYNANGIVFIITDGMNNAGKLEARHVKKALAETVKGEKLESVISILITVNVQDSQAKQELDEFHQEVGFTQVVNLDDATEKTLAKLAAFVSRSISSQSKSLGSGAASQPLTF